MSDYTVLPEGSAFGVMSLPLPKDHWIYKDNTPPPMTYRIGTNDPYRKVFSDQISEVIQYAIRASTMNGKEMDFDPDAMVQNAIIGFLGYSTKDGLGSESFQNPNPIPPLVK